MAVTILFAISPMPSSGGDMYLSKGATSGFETIVPLDSAMQYRAGEFVADRIIHMMGTLAGVVGSAIMVGIAADVADRSTFLASLVYSVCLLRCSAARQPTTSPPMDPEKRSSASSIMPRSF